MPVQRRKFLTSRRYRDSIWGSPKDPVKERSYPPGMHGVKGYKRLSDFGEQLKARKQLMTHYVMGERQFRKFFFDASKKKGNRGENFIGMLDSMLSVLVYRAKFANTMLSARKLVVQGHFTVNGYKVDRPAYRVFPGAVIAFRKKKMTNGQNFLLAQRDGTREVPDYIQLDDKNESFCFTRIPMLKDIPFVFTAETLAKIISKYS